jgi:hypothetical protein
LQDDGWKTYLARFRSILNIYKNQKLCYNIDRKHGGERTNEVHQEQGNRSHHEDLRRERLQDDQGRNPCLRSQEGMEDEGS